MAKRAISPEDKGQKRDLILSGAMSLLEEGRFPLPSVNDIIKHSTFAVADLTYLVNCTAL